MRPSKYRRGRRAVVLAGIAVGVVLVLGLLYWRDSRARYLRAAILAPERSFARLGLSLYLETEEGKDRLARAYLEACDGRIPWTRREKTTAILDVEGHLCVARDGGPVTVRELRGDERDRFIRSSAPFLAPLQGRSFRPEKDPGFQVTFLPGAEVASYTGWYVSGADHKGWYLWGGVTSIVEDEALAAMKAATALLIEPVAITSP